LHHLLYLRSLSNRAAFHKTLQVAGRKKKWVKTSTFIRREMDVGIIRKLYACEITAEEDKSF
jgi:hypothetical protein